MPGRAIRTIGLLAAWLLLALSPAVAQLLPGTEYTTSGPYRAWLAAPTDRYRHGVFGKAIEAGSLVVEKSGAAWRTVTLPPNQVFEDRRVRLHDLDGDGVPEAIVIRASLTQGASIVAYGLKDGALGERAASTPIGSPNRWLNIVGIGNFAGDGRAIIAAVVTPHLAGSLRFYALSGNALSELGRIDGFTNHIMGSADLDLGRMADADGDGVPDVVLPTLDRRQLAAVTFRGGQPNVLFRLPVEGRIVRLLPPNGGAIAAVLEQGKSYRVALPRR